MALEVGKAADTFTLMQGDSRTVVERARKASDLTIPGMIPVDGQNEHQTFSQPYQSIGARCVSHLSSALLLTLFPPNLPFYRLTIDELTSKELGEDRTAVEASLAILARVVHTLMENANLRPAMVEVLRHLIVAGNCLLFAPEDAPARLYRIDQYVVRRDVNGQLVRAIIREQVTPAALPEEVLTAAKVDPTSTEKLELFTVIDRVGDNMEWRQEVKGVVVSESEGTAPVTASPWMALRWLAVPGSDYGRSHVTEYIGDLLSLEDLYKAMVQFSAEAARIVRLVDPNSTVDIEELAAAETGDYIHGEADRVQTIQLDKSQDWSVMERLAEKLEGRLSAAFLLKTSVRDAERVTAEEIRLVAQELENVLGGTYTILSSELQLPLARRYMHVGVRLGRVPELPQTISPVVVTGFDALGRAHGANRIRAWLMDAQNLGLDIKGRVHEDRLIRRLGTDHGVDGLDELMKTADEMAADAEASQHQNMVDQAAPHVIKAATEGAVAQQQQQQQPLG